MAQSDVVVNHRNHQSFLQKNIEMIRMIENDTDEVILPNETKDNFQCTYFRRRKSKTSVGNYLSLISISN